MTNISQGHYANFGQRFAAILIDTIPLVLLQWILAYLIGQSMADDYANGYVTLDEVKQKATAWVWVIGVVVSWLYFALFESSEKQATPGKMIVGLTVTDLSGNRLGFGQATGRHFSKLASTLILFIGYLMPLWTQKRQALHDIISGCLIEQGGAKAVKSEREIIPDLESLQGGELDSKAPASSGSSSQLNRAYQSKTALSAADLVRLEQITSLRDRGTLSQSQFETERDIILGAAEPISQAADAPPAISPPPPSPPPPPASSSTAATNVQGTNGANVIFIIVILLLLLIAVFAFWAATQSSPAEESAEIDASVAATDAVDNEDANNCYDSVERENWSAAIVYCGPAAEQGDPAAQTNLGYLYAAGKGMAENDLEAVRWYRKAAVQGNVDGQLNLGVMYDNGEGVAEDNAEAVRWYRKAADQGNAPAQSNLGAMYDLGEGVAEDNAEAVRWYRKAADQGIALAQSNLGVMYDIGDGVAEDNAEAERWYRKAAEQGNVDGQYNLGVMYDYGEGVVEDDAEAALWYRKAAEQGAADAKKRLAELGY